MRTRTKHEKEHVPSVRVARRIAADHLVEDPHYYTHLAEMEKRHGNPQELTGFDLFEDMAEAPEPTARDIVAKTLGGLVKGDTVRVGRSAWTVWRAHGLTVYVTKAGSAGRKLYVLRPADSVLDGTHDVEVLEVSPGSGNLLGGPPAAVGPLELSARRENPGHDVEDIRRRAAAALGGNRVDGIPLPFLLLLEK